MNEYTPPGLLLIGYRFSNFTVRAGILLNERSIRYIFRAAPAGIHPDGSGFLGITKVPALRNVDNLEIRIADGLDEIKQWLKNLEY